MKKFAASCLFVAASACATPGPGGALAPPPPARGPNLAGNCAALWNLVPAGAEAVVALDLGLVRTSPWTQALLNAGQGPQRTATVQQHGFDEVADMDALLIVKMPGAAPQAPSLQLMRGRFDSLRVQMAFRKRHLDARADDLHGLMLLDTGDEALAVVAPRILATGPSNAVRAVIDLHRGRGHPIGDEAWLGQLRDGLATAGHLSHGAVAMELVVNAGSALQTEIAAIFEGLVLPAQVIAVVQIGSGLQVGLLGAAPDRRAAEQVARRIEDIIGRVARRPSVVALGLGQMMEGTRVQVHGPQVLVTGGLKDVERAVVAERLAAVAKIIATKKAEAQPDVAP